MIDDSNDLYSETVLVCFFRFNRDNFHKVLCTSRKTVLQYQQKIDCEFWFMETVILDLAICLCELYYLMGKIFFLIGLCFSLLLVRYFEFLKSLINALLICRDGLDIDFAG